MRCLVAQNLECQRVKAIAGEDGGRLVERAVDGRFTAAHIVVVHRGQVVMDQAVDVDAFKRGGDAQGRGTIDVE